MSTVVLVSPGPLPPRLISGFEISLTPPPGNSEEASSEPIAQFVSMVNQSVYLDIKY